jgi:hypothetical protein
VSLRDDQFVPPSTASVAASQSSCQGEDALKDPGRHPGRGMPAVALQVELAFEGVVDRFDDLAQWFEEPGSRWAST